MNHRRAGREVLRLIQVGADPPCENERGGVNKDAADQGGASPFEIAYRLLVSYFISATVLTTPPVPMSLRVVVPAELWLAGPLRPDAPHG